MTIRPINLNLSIEGGIGEFLEKLVFSRLHAQRIAKIKKFCSRRPSGLRSAHKTLSKIEIFFEKLVFLEKSGKNEVFWDIRRGEIFSPSFPNVFRKVNQTHAVTSLWTKWESGSGVEIEKRTKLDLFIWYSSFICRFLGLNSSLKSSSLIRNGGAYFTLWIFSQNYEIGQQIHF